MEFRIADTFVDSLARLNNAEQKAVKTAVFDLQIDATRPGLGFHKLERARDPHFASVRVSSDLRLIVHQKGGNLLICYTGHHEDAYRWAERRKLETHPITGAAQLVEIRETIQEITVAAERPESAQKPRLFDRWSDEELLGTGVPAEWLKDVREATEDSYLELADHLPEEAAEALLELAAGGTPQAAVTAPAAGDPFEHPDAQRRFRVMSNVEELERALAFPWEKWTVFLHPEQRRFVTANFNGPARVSGSAGTGKTVVALHRAVHLAKTNPNSRVLLATFSEPLANSLQYKLRMLIQNQPRLGEQIDVFALNTLAEHLYRLNIGKMQVASAETIRGWIEEAAQKAGEHALSLHFLMAEWEQVVDAWQITSWEDYRDVQRLGRKTRLSEALRRKTWCIFEPVQDQLKAKGLITRAGMFHQLTETLRGRKVMPYDFIVVDEAQDVNMVQLRLLAVLAGERENGLFFAGDLGQRIFQQPFSWKSLGVDVRGRSKTLRINYRTSHQIRMQADKLLGPEITDVDGNSEIRKGTVSVFNGPEPEIRIFEDENEEIEAAAGWLRRLTDQGLRPEEMGVFVRSTAQISRGRRALEAAGLAYRALDDGMESGGGKASLCSMHLAKGLEFRAVAVMACDDEVLPLQERIEGASDTSELEEVYNTERHLLYVACTRARDYLWVSGVEPATEFLSDMKM